MPAPRHVVTEGSWGLLTSRLGEKMEAPGSGRDLASPAPNKSLFRGKKEAGVAV